MSEKEARIAAAYGECSTDTILVLGEGNHDCQRWRLTRSLRRKLIQELSKIEYEEWT